MFADSILQHSSVLPGSITDDPTSSSSTFIKRSRYRELLKGALTTTESSTQPALMSSEETNNTATIPGKRGIAFWRGRARLQKLDQFLANSVQSGDTTPTIASLGWRAWNDLASAMASRLSIPDAGVEPDGAILFSWDRDNLHFELEVFPDNQGEFFFIDHATDEMWECDYIIGQPIPEAVKDQLVRFLGL